MATLTEDIRCMTGFCGTHQKTHQKIVYSAVNKTLAVIAFLENARVITALQRMSSLHSPYKLFWEFSCLHQALCVLIAWLESSSACLS